MLFLQHGLNVILEAFPHDIPQ